MKEKLHKTNAARHLDTLGIPYELISYPVDEDDLGAQHVAAATGQTWRKFIKRSFYAGSAPDTLCA